MAKTKMRTVDMSIVPDEIEGAVKTKLPKNTKKVKAKKSEEAAVPEVIVEAVEAPSDESANVLAEAETLAPEEEAPSAEDTKHKGQAGRSKQYVAARSHVDRTKTYELNRAVELVKKTSYSRFAGTVVADMVTKDDKVSATFTFPHSTGKTVRVAIATEELLTKIEAGTIDFDVLVAEPKMMPKLAKFARVLGPKGLMPNPKTGTVSDNPEKKVKELSGGSLTVKTEKKNPLMHVVVGKTDMDEKALADNVLALMNAVGPKKVKKLVLSATMSPGIKVDITPYQVA